jgi:hypothetical protein
MGEGDTAGTAGVTVGATEGCTDGGCGAGVFTELPGICGRGGLKVGTTDAGGFCKGSDKGAGGVAVLVWVGVIGDAAGDRGGFGGGRGAAIDEILIS